MKKINLKRIIFWAAVVIINAAASWMFIWETDNANLWAMSLGILIFIGIYIFVDILLFQKKTYFLKSFFIALFLKTFLSVVAIFLVPLGSNISKILILDWYSGMSSLIVVSPIYTLEEIISGGNFFAVLTHTIFQGILLNILIVVMAIPIWIIMKIFNYFTNKK